MSRYNDGQLTQKARNNLIDYEYEINEINSANLFKNGLIKRILELGYQGKKEDLSAVCNFICTKFKKNNITIEANGKPCTRAYVNSWLRNSPEDFGESRNHIYKLCFALEMNADQTGEFFLKRYLCRPYNFKNSDECVYYFCLNTGRSYNEAIKLINKVEDLPNEKSTANVETRLMEFDISEIETEEDFLFYMLTHRYDKKEQHQTIKKEIASLYEDCKKLSGITKTRANSALLRKILGYDERDYESGFSMKAKMPDAVKLNFPKLVSFSQIKNNSASDDTYKKMLILLFFYKFYTSLKNNVIKNGTSEYEIDLSGNFDEFEVMIDQLLDKCGYVQIYHRNPYDAFILSCAKQEDPLEFFKGMIDKYYLKIADD